MIRLSTARCLPLVVSLLLGACASKPPEPVETPIDPLAAAASRLGPDEVLSRIGGLQSQTLDAGDCGLFLWLKRDDSPLVFFQRSDGSARMVVDGVVQDIRRTSVSRTIAYQFFEKQTFEWADIAIDVAVIPESKRSLQRGLKLPGGSIALKTGEGWSAVLPVAGVIGCK